MRSDAASDLEAGASIAVNGVCLTVVEVEGDVFFADVVPETRRRTNIGLLRAGEAETFTFVELPGPGLFVVMSGSCTTQLGQS